MALIFSKEEYKNPICFDFVTAKPGGRPNSTVLQCSSGGLSGVWGFFY